MMMYVYNIRREKGDADNDDPFADDGEDDMRKGGGAATAAASFPRPWPGRIFFQVLTYVAL